MAREVYKVRHNLVKVNIIEDTDFDSLDDIMELQQNIRKPSYYLKRFRGKKKKINRKSEKAAEKKLAAAASCETAVQQSRQAWMEAIEWRVRDMDGDEYPVISIHGTAKGVGKGASSSPKARSAYR